MCHPSNTIRSYYEELESNFDDGYVLAMKLLYTSSDHILVSRLKDVLESEGIACAIKNEVLSGLAPEVPFTETFPELWIQNDTDFDRAEAIKQDWKVPSTTNSARSWQCPNCHEQLEAQFSSCWKCGSAKIDTAAIV